MGGVSGCGRSQRLWEESASRRATHTGRGWLLRKGAPHSRERASWTASQGDFRKVGKVVRKLLLQESGAWCDWPQWLSLADIPLPP